MNCCCAKRCVETEKWEILKCIFLVFKHRFDCDIFAFIGRSAFRVFLLSNSSILLLHFFGCVENCKHRIFVFWRFIKCGNLRTEHRNINQDKWRTLGAYCPLLAIYNTLFFSIWMFCLAATEVDINFVECLNFLFLNWFMSMTSWECKLICSGGWLRDWIGRFVTIITKNVEHRPIRSYLWIIIATTVCGFLSTIHIGHPHWHYLFTDLTIKFHNLFPETFFFSGKKLINEVVSGFTSRSFWIQSQQ